MSDNETAAMSKVRNILRNYGMEWPNDEWVEDLALELLAEIRIASLGEVLADLRKTSIVTLAGTGGAYEWFNKRMETE